VALSQLYPLRCGPLKMCLDSLRSLQHHSVKTRFFSGRRFTTLIVVVVVTVVIVLVVVALMSVAVGSRPLARTALQVMGSTP
jgi:hypothetical protein